MLQIIIVAPMKRVDKMATPPKKYFFFLGFIALCLSMTQSPPPARHVNAMPPMSARNQRTPFCANPPKIHLAASLMVVFEMFVSILNEDAPDAQNRQFLISLCRGDKSH